MKEKIDTFGGLHAHYAWRMADAFHYYINSTLLCTYVPHTYKRYI